MYVHTQAYTCTRVIGDTQIKQLTTSEINEASSGITSHCEYHRAEQTNERLSKKQLFRKHTQAHTYGHTHRHTQTHRHTNVHRAEEINTIPEVVCQQTITLGWGTNPKILTGRSNSFSLTCNSPPYKCPNPRKEGGAEGLSDSPQQQ